MDRTYPLGSEAFALAAETYRGPRERGQKREQLVDAVAATAPSEAFSSGLRAALLSVLSGGTPGAWGEQHALTGLGQEARIDLLLILFERFDAPLMIRLPTSRKLPLDERLLAQGFNRQSLDVFAQEFWRSRSPQVDSSRRQPFPHQTDLLSEGAFSVLHPLTGEQVSSSLALPVTRQNGQVFLFYHFAGPEPFFVSVDPIYGELVSVFMPERNLELTGKLHRHIPWDIACLKALMVEFGADTARQLASREHRRLTLLYGSFNHIGHAMLNEYDACHQCARRGLFEKVEALLIGEAAFIAPASLFPELAGKPQLSGRNLIEVYRQVVEGGLTLVRPTTGSFWFSLDLRERFRRVAAGVTPSPALLRARQCEKLIWIEVRTNDRFWVGQVAGVAALIRALQHDIPGLGVVLAGWSRPDGAGEGVFDQIMIGRDHSATATILSLLDDHESIFQITGVTTSEKVAWSFEIDAYAISYSSGIVFPACIGGHPGVVHSNRYYQEKLLTRPENGTLQYLENCPQIHFVPPNLITEVEPNGNGNRNYDLNWQDIYTPLKDFLRLAPLVKCIPPA